jgi:glycosyltransferase involved in cell wall biosynthesis
MDTTICITSFNRKKQLLNTLDSFKKYDNNRFNVIIVDDCSNYSELMSEEEIQSYPFKITYVPIRSQNQWWINPVVPLNIVTSLVDTPKMIIQHAECYHYSNILNVMDSELSEKDYIAFSCFALNKEVEVDNFNFENGIWYTHSIFNQRPYHFCCAIHTEDFKRAGGYDWDLAKGFWYDDDMLLKSLGRNDIKIKISDNGVVLHQWHESKWETANFEELRQRNFDIFSRK